MKYIVYKHTNSINGKSYIGFTKNSLEQRFEKHLYDANHGSSLYFHNALRKYGREVWISSILYHCVDHDEASRVEPILISEYNTFGEGGYNLNEGGVGSKGHIVSIETKQKMSEDRKQNSYLVKNPLRGEANHMYKIGTKHPLYGLPRSTETRKKISDNHADTTGANNPNAKHIRLKSPDGIIYDVHGSLKQFCKEHNLAYSSMNLILKYNRQFISGSVKGWKCWIV